MVHRAWHWSPYVNTQTLDVELVPCPGCVCVCVCVCVRVHTVFDHCAVRDISPGSLVNQTLRGHNFMTCHGGGTLYHTMTQICWCQAMLFVIPRPAPSREHLLWPSNRFSERIEGMGLGTSCAEPLFQFHEATNKHVQRGNLWTWHSVDTHTHVHMPSCGEASESWKCTYQELMRTLISSWIYGLLLPILSSGGFQVKCYGRDHIWPSTIFFHIVHAQRGYYGLVHETNP